MTERTDGAAATKSCIRCQESKGLDEFHRDRRRKDGRFPYCIACRIEYDGRTPRAPRMFATKAEYDRAYRDKMPLRERSTRHRETYLWATFRMSVSDYEAMLERQGNVCAICESDESSTRKGTLKHLSVDHDHRCCPGKTSCGKCVRGLLCARCNHGIGHFRDDSTLMQAAIGYLTARSLG